MSAIDPASIRPLDGWCVIKMEPRPSMVRGILLPVSETTAERLDKGTGHVVRIGSGPKNNALGLKDGSRVVFRSFLKHANPIESEVGKYFLISTSDIVGEVQPGVDVGVYSSKENTHV